MKKKNKNETEFICPLCKTKERIPTKIIEMLGEVNQLGVNTDI